MNDMKLSGALYLVPLFCGPFSMLYVPSAGFAPEGLLRAGLAGHCAILLSEVALTAALYSLLRPAGPRLALTATFSRLAMTAVQAVNLFPLLAALELDQPELVQLAFQVHLQGVHVWETFFALHCLLVGVLLHRSAGVPRALGLGMGLAAGGYALNGLGNLLWPQGGAFYQAVVGVGALVGEVPFVLWLLFAQQPVSLGSSGSSGSVPSSSTSRPSDRPSSSVSGSSLSVPF